MIKKENAETDLMNYKLLLTETAVLIDGLDSLRKKYGEFIESDQRLRGCIVQTRHFLRTIEELLVVKIYDMEHKNPAAEGPD